MAVIDQLIVQFSADFKELSRELQKAQGETSRAMKGMEDALKPIGAAFRTLGALAAAAGVSLSVGFVKNTLDAVGGIGELAEQLGTSTEMLQVYEFAAAQAGVEQGQLEAGLSKLTKTLGDAAAGEETAVKAFRALGVSVLDAKGNIRGTDTVIADIADKIAGVEDPAKRAAMVVDVFGKSGQRLLPILSQGAAGLQNYRTEAHATGAVISGSLIGKADAASDSIAAMTKSFETLAKQIVAMASGPIKEFADAWVSALKRINENSRFQKGLDEQKDHIKLLQEERRLIEQISQMKRVVGENPLPKDAAAIRAMEDRVAAIRAQVTAAAVPASAPAASAPTGGGGGTIPRSQAEINKAAEDARRAEEKAAKEMADRIQATNETVAQSMIDTYTGVDKYLEEQKTLRDERLTAEMESVSKGLDALNTANNERLREAYEANLKAIEDNKREFREYADIVGEGFQDMILNARKFDDVLKGLLARFATKAIGSATDSLFGSILGSLFGKAGGGTISGPTLVGERGPEIFNPGGSGTILPMSRVGGSGAVTYNIDARGADPSVLPRIQVMLEQTKREAAALAVSTVRTRNFREPAFLGRGA